MKSNRILSTLCCSCLFLLPCLVSAEGLLTPGIPVELNGTQGKFDFVKIDPANHRFLACHTGNGTLDVIDVATSKMIKSIPTGAAQGVALDPAGGRYFLSVSKPPKLVIIDANKLEITGEVSLSDPADLVAYHVGTDRVYVCNDEKPELWIIDPTAKKIISTITFPGAGMEDLCFDDHGAFLFQCLKDSSELIKVDVKDGKIVAHWPTAPADKPHGMEPIRGTDTAVIVGGTGKLVLIDLSTGKILASTDIALKVDEIAYDSVAHRVYCASGSGTISVVAVEANSLQTLKSLTSAPGAHSVAVDSKTHTAWIAFAKDGKSYIQSFTEK